MRGVRAEHGRGQLPVIAMELLLIVAIVIVFELAAARWSYDSRDGFNTRRR